MNLLHRYNTALKKNPLSTKMATSGVIAALGDTMCQYFEQSKTYWFLKFLIEYNLSSNDKDGETGFNLTRTRNFVIMGTFFSAPILHIHFSKLLPMIAPKATAMGCIKKLFVDQIMISPLFMVGWYSAISALDGKSVK